MSIVLFELQDILDDLWHYRNCTVVEDDRMLDTVQTPVPRSWKDRIFNGDFFRKHDLVETTVPSTKVRVVGTKIFVHSDYAKALNILSLHTPKGDN